MPAEPVPADPGRDDDLAWLDRDPMTAQEREEWLDRVCEQDEPPEPEEYEDFAPLTAEELAEVRRAAADDLLAVEAATTGRRGLVSPARRGCSPASRPARLPGTMAAFLDGTITRFKAELITGATALLDSAEARVAEQEVLDRAGRLTPGGLRAAIARAVMKAAPEKARERRETAAKNARVERWAEDSGNAALMGCELPPDEVLAADQRITAWARELKQAGLDGGMDQLRARAFLDLLLGKDSRCRPGDTQPGTPGQAGPATQDSTLGPAPGGFASRVTLTVPLATLTGLAGRPGELAGLGPVDPWLARDLATAAARKPEAPRGA